MPHFTEVFICIHKHAHTVKVNISLFTQTVALNPGHAESGQFGLTSMQLSINFLLHTYFRTRKKLRYSTKLPRNLPAFRFSLVMNFCFCCNRTNLELWVKNVEQLLRLCQPACQWLMELLTCQHGTNYLK